MSAHEQTAIPPKLTTVLARALPGSLRPLACLGFHTIPAGYGPCAVCCRDWTGKGRRRWLRAGGTRSPHRRGCREETAVHLLVAPWLQFHRVAGVSRSYYWIVAWRRHGDHHEARLRPRIDFGHRNVSTHARAEEAARQRRATADQEQE
jgi:hypothetical protein